MRGVVRNHARMRSTRAGRRQFEWWNRIEAKKKACHSRSARGDKPTYKWALAKARDLEKRFEGAWPST